MAVNKREIKTAQNKQAILNSLLIRMDSEAFDAIKISALCADAKLSQASFYNYFPQKTDILIYYIQLWAVKMHWQITLHRQLTGLSAIEALFNSTAKICATQPQLMAEIISYQAKAGRNIQMRPLTDADKLVAYPDYKAVETVNIENLSALLSVNIEQAVRSNELPPSSDTNSLIVSLCAIFFTVPIMFNQRPLIEIEEAYQQQLSLFRHGANSKFS
ncbi:hypothetical protein CW745_08525 [Psychromonas sp. psych-6C06]|uniref:TetR/AcrR family transcriptional regulator n=1 Tax=Psychromonas sp. psych-6C06 TaxID=2058089 RepID=UPI000C337167|nr:TetR/AcrR family transcriptional regulator [Psychromonas sp. psych-6C06]PKF62020.1 hypothetical protein CW745_08525 [Psychromonas sp. psych-6C06]